MKLKELFTEADRTVLVVLVSSSLVLATFLNYGNPSFAGDLLGRSADDEASVVWMFLSALLLFGIVPCVVWKAVLRRDLREIGIAAGDVAAGTRITLPALVLLVLPATFLSSRLAEIRSEYPLAADVGRSASVFLLYQGAYLLYYVGWETFFRGYLVLGLADRIGPLPAVGLSTLVSTAVHLGKPCAEVWGAVAVGFLFGWLALRTRSILWPLIVHAAVGVLNDVFVVFLP